MPLITPLPTAPNRSNPSTFSADADTFLAALAQFATEVNAVGQSMVVGPMGLAGGTADALTVDFTPDIALTNGQTVLIRSSYANATTAPTFSPDGLTATAIVKGANTPLVAGDIAGAGHWLQMQYDETLAKWVLQNPAVAASCSGNAATATNADKLGGQPSSYYLNTLTVVPAANLPAFRGAQVYPSSNVSVLSQTYTRIPFNTEVYDTSAIHDNATNNARLTVPAGVSKVRLHAQISVVNTDTAFNGTVSIEINHTAYAVAIANSTVAAFMGVNLSSGVISVVTGDFFELGIWTSTAREVTGGSSATRQYQTWFSMEIIE